MNVRRPLARFLLRLARWKVVGEAPREGIVVVAPHTSNWDFVVTLLAMWSIDAPLRVLIKKEAFRGPLGWFLRSCGGIAIDRAHPAGVVRELCRAARGDEPFLLVIAAEGTRRRARYWKSGFYRIALDSGLPIVLAFIDGGARTAGFGPTLVPTGDVAADMDVVRAFYADKPGLRPAWRTEPRLRGERRGGTTETSR
jgi:1-acyl-sn-glycerol-3-phosphate acyltransferase